MKHLGLGDVVGYDIYSHQTEVDLKPNDLSYFPHTIGDSHQTEVDLKLSQDEVPVVLSNYSHQTEVDLKPL